MIIFDIMSYFRYIDNGEGPTKLFIGGVHGDEGKDVLPFLIGDDSGGHSVDFRQIAETARIGTALVRQDGVHFFVELKFHRRESLSFGHSRIFMGRQKNKKCAAPMELHTEKRMAPFVATQIQYSRQSVQNRACIFTEAKMHAC